MNRETSKIVNKTIEELCDLIQKKCSASSDKITANDLSEVISATASLVKAAEKIID